MSDVTQERTGIIISDEHYAEMKELGEDVTFVIASVNEYKYKLKMAVLALNSLKNNMNDVKSKIMNEHNLEDENWVVDDDNKEIVLLKEND